jgi:glycine oxidase
MRKIIVVGSGVIGLSGAMLLALDGFKVTVISRDIKEASSWVAGGMLAPFSEGLDGVLFDFSYESLKLYPEYIKLISELSGQKIDFWDGGIYRVVLKGEEHLLRVAQNYKSMGYQVDVVEEPQRHMHWLSREVLSVVHYSQEAWIDAKMLMEALLQAAKRLGVEFLEDSILKVVRKDGLVYQLEGAKDTYRADLYIFCVGAWSGELLGLPVFPVKGQALKVGGASVPRVHYSTISYLIPRRDYLYIGATSEEKSFEVSNSLKGVHSLIEGAVRVVPNVEIGSLVSVFVGFRPATPDGMPIIERGGNFMAMTGHYRNGILHAPLSAKLVVDFVEVKGYSPYYQAFSPDRFSA